MGKARNGAWSDDPRDLLRSHPDHDLDELERDATPGWNAGKKAAKPVKKAAKKAAPKKKPAKARRGK